MAVSLQSRVVPLLFFLTGAETLIIEATWLRSLRNIRDATAPAVSVTLVALPFGQFLGAVLDMQIVRRARRPLVAFGACQLAFVLLTLTDRRLS